MAEVKKTRATKSPAQLKAELVKAKAKVAALEERAFASVLAEKINKSNIVSSFNAIKASADGASDLIVLAAVGKAAGIPRLVITQSEPAARKKKEK